MEADGNRTTVVFKQRLVTSWGGQKTVYSGIFTDGQIFPGNPLRRGRDDVV